MAVDLDHEPALVAVERIEGSRRAGMGRGRIMSLIGLFALSAAGWAYALGRSFGEPEVGSSAERIEEVLRRPDGFSTIGAVVVIGVMVAIVVAAGVAALRRHAE